MYARGWAMPGVPGASLARYASSSTSHSSSTLNITPAVRAIRVRYRRDSGLNSRLMLTPLMTPTKNLLNTANALKTRLLPLFCSGGRMACPSRARVMTACWVYRSSAPVVSGRAPTLTSASNRCARACSMAAVAAS